ncbi:MAG TPA: DUF2341 domain-containing protein [Bryobacteraceae bacterium]|nr:DUF2341 domain-containing protein [Bryobacteraceae bacterium]
MLISGTYSYLATASNGGKVQSPNGYDIIFSSTCDPSTKLDHQVETYNAFDGTIRMWVRIPNLSHTTDTVIYMWYGNAGILTSQENRTGVWDSTFQGVWHLSDGVTLSATDSTQNGHNGTISAATAVSGQVDGAASFGGAGQLIDIGNVGARPAQGTISMWLKAPALANYPNAFTTAPLGTNCGNAGIRFELHADGSFTAPTGGDSANCSAVAGPTFTTAFTPNVWHHLAVTWDASAGIETAYYDGRLGQSVFDPYWATTFGAVKIGAGFDSSRPWSGQVDEVRMEISARSAAWIAAEYANQFSPATFYTIGAENALTVGVSPSPLTLYQGQSQQFSATVYGSCNQGITWTANLQGVGTLAASGLYTAPATLSSTQTLVLTATSQADPTKTASATVTLSPTLTLAVTPAVAGPYLTATPQTFTVSVSNAGGGPVAGIPVTFAATGLNSFTGSAVTGPAGTASFSYTGSLRGAAADHHTCPLPCARKLCATNRGQRYARQQYVANPGDGQSAGHSFSRLDRQPRRS